MYIRIEGMNMIRVGREAISLRGYNQALHCRKDDREE